MACSKVIHYQVTEHDVEMSFFFNSDMLCCHHHCKTYRKFVGLQNVAVRDSRVYRETTVKSEIHTMVNVKAQAFWDVMPFSVVNDCL
jgi:hypothetical protein